jgi:hypothetical protein
MIIDINTGEQVTGAFKGFSTIIGKDREECLSRLQDFKYVDDQGESIRTDTWVDDAGVTQTIEKHIYTMVGGELA